MKEYVLMLYIWGEGSYVIYLTVNSGASVLGIVLGMGSIGKTDSVFGLSLAVMRGVGKRNVK